jgi:hypothetical protein
MTDVGMKDKTDPTHKGLKVGMGKATDYKETQGPCAPYHDMGVVVWLCAFITTHLMVYLKLMGFTAHKLHLSEGDLKVTSQPTS